MAVNDGVLYVFVLCVGRAASSIWCSEGGALAIRRRWLLDDQPYFHKYSLYIMCMGLVI